jgi:hypothetical protein
MFPTNVLYAFLFSPFVLHALLISSQQTPLELLIRTHNYRLNIFLHDMKIRRSSIPDVSMVINPKPRAVFLSDYTRFILQPSLKHGVSFKVHFFFQVWIHVTTMNHDGTFTSCSCSVMRFRNYFPPEMLFSLQTHSLDEAVIPNSRDSCGTFNSVILP